ncbi:MAG: hypothetical protein LH632_15355 [Rhodoferax sp.]|nr:hypothetical protein [Rhodoferax sp.]
MSTAAWIATGALTLYAVFLIWYGGRTRPLSAVEVDSAITLLDRNTTMPGHEGLLDQLRTLLSNDDGAEFVMHNLVRYRAKALYPAGHNFGDDARAADRRYGRAIAWPLIRRACLPVFIARRSGSLIEPPGAQQWDYIASVRYRSRRDFLHFAQEIERVDIVMHKWAAIEETHVFRVTPLVSLALVRCTVGAILAFAALMAIRLAG